MKRKLFLILAITAVTILTLAAAKGPKTDTRAYPINGEYTKIVINAPFDVSFSDTAKAAMVTIPEDFQKQVVIQAENGTLHIAFHNKSKLKKRPVVVLPRNDRINDIELLGAATLKVGKLEHDEVRVYLAGASHFLGNIIAKDVHIEQVGASDYKGHLSVENAFVDLSAASSLELRGRALFKLTIKMIEASSLDAEKFEARRIEGSIDGASNAILWCTERMVVPVRNASHITYIGHPLVVNCPTYDISTVTHKNF